MGLRDRLRRLEDRPEVKRCPECKLPPEGPGYTVYAEDEDREQEYCPRCGRPMLLIVEVVGGEF